jgi:four helix bundle protein
MNERERTTRDNRFRGDLPERTFEFAVTILQLVDQLPQGPKGWKVTNQLLSSGTSIGANVHEAGQAVTEPDFVHKCGIARKEASETHFWLRLCQRSGLLAGDSLITAINEADQFCRILGTIIKKTQARTTPAPRESP